MKLVRLAVLLFTCSGFCFAVNKDMLALQRELGRPDLRLAE